MPTSAPTIAPESSPCGRESRHPATAALTARATGSARSRIGSHVCRASSLTSDAHHSTPAAVSGTEQLSSSLIGIVSTRAAAAAATNGAPSENHGGRRNVGAGRHHQPETHRRRPPNTQRRRAGDGLLPIPGIRGAADVAPTIVAMPSPDARMPQAAATMSRRAGRQDQQQDRERIERDARARSRASSSSGR